MGRYSRVLPRPTNQVRSRARRNSAVLPKPTYALLNSVDDSRSIRHSASLGSSRVKGDSRSW